MPEAAAAGRMEGLVLQVKHLPAALSTDAIETLLKHVGATRIRVLANKTQKSKTALAVFLDNTTRMSALARLNTMRLSDHDIFAKVYDVTDGPELEAARPSPDIASTKPLHNIPPTTGPASAEPAAIFPPLPRDPPPPPTITCAWRHPAPLAPHLGLHFPPSPLLEYKYPKASPDVVLNIANALMALPTFYTQVLHLMNKMNLPPPFEPNAIPGHFASFVANDTRKQKRDMVFVEEQDDDDDADLAARNLSTKRIRVVPPLPPPTPPANPPSPHSTPSSNGAIRRPEPPTLTEPTPPRTNAVVAVPLKLAPPKSRKPEAMANIFEDVAVAATTKVMPRPGVISEAELARTRLSAEELAQHKHMQNYQVGEPSHVLYVKNIAASVDVSDLTYIFGSVFESDQAMAALSIRLFTEGRLKGQAFVAFPSIELAVLAQSLVHGVVLDEKPLIVCFRKQPTQHPPLPPPAAPIASAPVIAAIADGDVSSTNNTTA